MQGGSFTPSFKKKLLTSASDMSRFRSQLSRLNAALAKRVLSELPQRPCSDTTLLRAVRNCAEMGQGRLTRHGVALHRACESVRRPLGHADPQTAPLNLNQAVARVSRVIAGCCHWP
jgi:hypothetical protein